MASDCNVKVICRFRPINQRELKEGANSEVTIEYPNESSVNIVEESNKQPQLFTLDRVFNSDTKQEQIFETISESINDVIEGFNATIFAYGQTGSGKSFTMFGPSIEEEELCGIIPRSCKYIFDYIHSDTTGIEFTIKCSFLEIYKEDVKDLLNPSKQQKSLRIRESASKGVWVEGLVEICVTSVNEVLDLLKTGEKFRTVTSTNMNAVSSRSHSLFILTLIQKMKDGSVKTGKLNLADLAGSEKVGKTGAKGNTLEEAKKINQSLSSLGNCINALTKENKAHVPYRDSKLTFILRESLGGNTKTTLIVACSPHPFNITETLSTLRFAQRAKTIKNTVTVNTKRSVEELESIIKGLLLELNDLKYYVKHLEKELSVFKGSEWSPEIEKKKIFENRNQHLPTLNISETSEKPNTEITPNTNPENTQIQEVMSKIESTTQKDLNQIENQVRIDKINEQLKEEIESLKDQVNTFKEEEQVSKKQINTLKETLQQKEEELKKISHEFQSIKQKTSTDSEKLEYVSKQLRYEIETSKLELKMAHDKYDQLKELNTNQYLEIKNLENQLNEIKKLKEEIDYKFRETSSQFVQLQEKENQTEHKYQEVLNERNNMKKQLELTVEEKRNLLEKEKALKTQLSQVQLQLEEAKVDFNSKLEEKEINESNLNNNIEKLKQQVQMLQESLSTSSEKIQQSIISEESLKKKDELLESLTNENLENKKKVLNVQSLLTQKDLECKSIISQFEEFTSQTQSYIKLMEKSELENNNKITEKENKILQLENEIQEFKQLIEQNKQKNYEVLREEINQWSLKLNKAEQLKKTLEEKLQENENHLEEERKRALILKEKQETSNSRIQELEHKLEEAIRNYETTQIDLETALSLNIENAKKFERELQYTEDLFKLREERRKTNIVKSIFSENTSSPSRWFKKKDPLPIANALGETDKSGYLYKQGDWVRSWRKKWMVLKGDKIYIFDSPQDEKPKAQIELNDCFIRKDEELIGMDNSFGIYNTINVKKVNFLRADTQEERDEWISAINQNIENLKFLK